MEIHNTQKNTNLFKLVCGRIKSNLGIKILLSLVLFCLFALFFIIVGAEGNKSMNDYGQKKLFRAMYRRVLEHDYSFISKYTDSQFVDIEEFKIDMKFDAFEKIRYLRSQGLSFESLFVTKEMQEKVPAKITINNQTYEVKLGLTGERWGHIQHPYKWSFSVDVKGGKTIMGMSKFALLFPEARGYLTDWIAFEMLKEQNSIGIRGEIVNVNVNGKNHGIYYLEERFDKKLLENNRFKEGILFKILENDLKVYGLKKILKNKDLSDKLVKLKQLIHAYINKDIGPEQIFDLKKFASLLVVSDVMNNLHGVLRSNMRLYFNPITGLIEPIGREWGWLRELNQTETVLSLERPNKFYSQRLHDGLIFNGIINSMAFKEEYLKQADIISNPVFLDKILENKSEELDILLKKIYKEQPFYRFPVEILHKNQRFIRNKLYPKSKMIDLFYLGRKGDSVLLKVDNKLDLPIEIYYYTYRGSKKMVPSERIVLKSGYNTSGMEEIAIQIPRGVNADVFSIENMDIHYGILGVNNVHSTVIYPSTMTKKSFSLLNPSRQSSNASEFSFLRINEDKKQIQFSSGLCRLDRDLVLPKGYIVSAKCGTQIDLTNSAKIISYSHIVFQGKKDSLVTLFSSDSTGQGIVVFNEERTSDLSFVKFLNLSNIATPGWSLRGAITFYEAPVNISNCIFSNNLLGDDYLNIVRTNFNISNTKFEFTKADALDTDYCKGVIKNCEFTSVGNDAIDISGTKLYIESAIIDKSGDKGISAGEGSHIIGKKIRISESEIAIASKDNSIVDIEDIEIESSKLAYCAFQKKAEFGPGTIKVNNAISTNVGREHLIQIGSYLSINDSEVSEKLVQVKHMLYDGEYGSHSK